MRPINIRGPLFYVRLWFSLFKNALNRASEFRINLVGRGVTEFFWVSAQVVFVYALQSPGQSIGGWSGNELLLFFGFVTFVDALFMLFLHENLHEFDPLLRNGTFDFHLLRPVNSIFLSTLRFPGAVSIVNFLYSLSIISYASIQLRESLQFTNVLPGILYLFLGFLLIYLFNVIVLASAFWFSRANLINWLFFEFYRLSFRPDDFYYSWLRRFIFVIFPAAFFVSVPAKIYLGKTITALVWVGPWIVLLVGSVLAISLWKRGIKKYEGALS